MRLKTEFTLAIQVLTPLHIGTGHTLQEDYDYIVRDRQTLRLHEERFLAWIESRGEAFARLTQGVPPGQILGTNVSPTSELVRYAIPGVPEKTQEIRECLKDAYDRPYLPGSALKGALRTVLLWRAWNTQSLALARFRSSEHREAAKFAAQDLEKAVFGDTPHKSLLKALRLADSDPVPKEQLTLVNVRCVSRAARDGIPLALEAVKPNTMFKVEGHVDETAFRPWWKSAPKEGFLPEERRAWLVWEVLGQAAREKARKRLELDLRWAQKVGADPKPWNELLLQIQRAERGELQGFPLQIGFGTGWLGTTLGPALLSDPDFPRVYERFRLGVNPRTRRQTPLEDFPASRRLVRWNNRAMPLGWVWVLPKEVR